MRWMVTGSGGQLGRCLVEHLSALEGHTLVAAPGHAELDIGDPTAVAHIFEQLTGGAPDVLVNAAAFTAVDRCESEYEEALRINGQAPGRLAESCRRVGARLVHVSTDYVFDGLASEPYPEDAPIGPRTAYGRSKAAGERTVREALPDAIIVRTSWVFGPGRNFVGAILRQCRLRRRGEVEGPLRVVDDQRGSPTYAGDLARGIIRLVEALTAGPAGAEGRPPGLSAEYGPYHLSNTGVATWWDFARAILDRTGHADLEIERIETREVASPAPRPLYSVLANRRAAALGVSLPHWTDALDRYLASPAGRMLQDPAADE